MEASANTFQFTLESSLLISLKFAVCKLKIEKSRPKESFDIGTASLIKGEKNVL